jgi:hypothetical protein
MKLGDRLRRIDRLGDFYAGVHPGRKRQRWKIFLTCKLKEGDGALAQAVVFYVLESNVPR